MESLEFWDDEEKLCWKYVDLLGNLIFLKTFEVKLNFKFFRIMSI